MPPHCPDKDCPQAEAAARAAVKQVFAILGVNVDEPKEVAEFQEDLRFGKTMRSAANKGVVAIVTLAVGAILLAMAAGLLQKLGVHVS